MFFTINLIRLFVNQLKKLIPIDSAAPLPNSLSRYTFARWSCCISPQNRATQEGLSGLLHSRIINLHKTQRKAD